MKKIKKKYRTHKYETWLPEKPKTITKKENKEKTPQQIRNENFDF